MARTRIEIDELAQRIGALRAADRIKLLARLMEVDGQPADWSVLRRIRRRLPSRRPRGLDRLAVEATREVRRERRGPA